MGTGTPRLAHRVSTIATHFLGPQIDIHGGGADLIFPHHAAEIAQAEPANGCSPFVRCWMHVGMIYLDGEKMSKSLGNMIFVDQVLQKHTADGLRLSVLGHHYREEYEPTDAEFEDADRLAGRLREALESRSSGKGSPLDGAAERTRFLAALDEDFNTPDAVVALAKLSDGIVEAVEYGRDVRHAQATLRELGGVLGLTFKS